MAPHPRIGPSSVPFHSSARFPYGLPLPRRTDSSAIVAFLRPRGVFDASERAYLMGMPPPSG